MFTFVFSIQGSTFPMLLEAPIMSHLKFCINIMDLNPMYGVPVLYYTSYYVGFHLFGQVCHLIVLRYRGHFGVPTKRNGSIYPFSMDLILWHFMNSFGFLNQSHWACGLSQCKGPNPNLKVPVSSLNSFKCGIIPSPDLIIQVCSKKKIMLKSMSKILCYLNVKWEKYVHAFLRHPNAALTFMEHVIIIILEDQWCICSSICLSLICRNGLRYLQTNFERANRFCIWTVASHFGKCKGFDKEDAW